MDINNKDVMSKLRGIIQRLVSIRLEVMETARRMYNSNEMECITEDFNEAVLAMYKAEKLLGDAHQDLLIHYATKEAEAELRRN